MAKKVVVTGANGYIGRYVTKTLLDNGFQVVAADIRFENVDKRAERFEESILESQEDIFYKLGCPDICIHLAWQDGFVHNAPSHMGNLSKHYLFLRQLVEQGCKNLTVMGTMHEVGYWEGAITDTTPCMPLSLYGTAKNALRQAMILLEKEYEYELKWLRAYYILGDDLHNNSIFTKLLQAEQAGKTEFPFTSGRNQYDFIDVHDLGFQIAAASVQEEITGIINACTGIPVSLGDKVEEFIKKHNMKIQLKYGAFPDRAYDSPIVYGDNEKIKRILNATNLKKI